MSIHPLIRALRPRHWVKNLLIFVPTLAAHQVPSGTSSIHLLLGFIALSLVASSLYLINDLGDVEADRLHPVKSKRPIAAGDISIGTARITAVVMIALAFVVGYEGQPNFVWWLWIYALVSYLYSSLLKRIALIDCFVLAALYSLRVVAGGTISSIQPSFWLLATSGFLFLSLAFGKRFAEISLTENSGRDNLAGRNYRTTDAPVVLAFGVSSAFIAVMVLALYVNSEAVTELYRTPLAIWATVPILLLWVCSLWFRLWRHEVSDDPVLFALKDPVSLACGAAVLVAVIAGAKGWLL